VLGPLLFTLYTSEFAANCCGCFTNLWLPASASTLCCAGEAAYTRGTSPDEKLIRRAGSVSGMKLDSLVTVAERRTLDKLLDIIDNASHPLHTVVSNQRSLFRRVYCFILYCIYIVLCKLLEIQFP
jgi:hypothetical protein